MYNYLTKVIKPFFFLLLIVNIATAAPLVNFKSLDFEVELSSEADGIFRLSLTPLTETKQISEPEILELKDPYRLVLDLPGIASKTAKTVNVSSAFISSLRVGAHADKTRFVIDIKGDRFPEYQITKDQKTNAVSLEFVFADTSSMLKKIKESESEEEKEVDTSTSTSLSTTSTIKTTTSLSTSSTTTTSTTSTTTIPLIIKHQETTTTTPITTTSLTTVSTTIAVLKKEEHSKQSGVELKSIFFQVTENTRLPAVVFTVPGLKSYALNKLTEELYELVLDNSYLKGKHLELPQFPPDSFKGFAVINAADDKVKNKIIVKIYVDEGTKLFTYYTDDQLWVKVGN